MGNRKVKRKLEHWEVIAIYLLLYDIIAMNASYFMGLLLRFDLRYSAIPETYLSSFLRFAPVYTIFTVVVFFIFRLYKSVWRFASFSELNRIIGASAVVTIFQIVGITVFIRRMPISYYAFGAVMQFCLVTAVRFAYRFIVLERAKKKKSVLATRRAMIIGAGNA